MIPMMPNQDVMSRLQRENDSNLQNVRCERVGAQLTLTRIGAGLMAQKRVNTSEASV